MGKEVFRSNSKSYNKINITMHKVLVIIVTYNAMKWINKSFNSIYNSTIKSDLFVIDNGSSDGTQDYINKNYPQCIFFQSKINLGFGKANNIGLKYALDNNYDYVYLLNQDAWLYPHTIEKLISIHKENPQYGILSPFQIQANIKHLDENFGFSIFNWESNKIIIEDIYFNRIKDVYPVNFVMAAHWLMSKECIQKVGGFSPTFPHYGEDNNYIHRAKFHGFKIGVLPTEKVIHDRENRNITKEKRIYMSYILNLIILSNINNNSLFNKYKQIIKSTIRTIRKESSLKPILYFIKIIRQNSIIISNNRESIKQKAFIN